MHKFLSPVRSRRLVLAALFVVSVACTSDAAEPGPPVSWSPTDEGWRSGVAVGALPAGFSLVTNVGNEVSVGHRFEDADGNQLEVFRLIEPERFPIEGATLATSNGVTYMQGVKGDPISVFFETQGVRLGVSSPDLPVEDLLSLAQSLTYDPAADEWSG